MNNIYLIGMSGCGKTTVGSKLAGMARRELADIDQMLERGFGIPISSVFEQFGESIFRDEETRILLEVSKKHDLVVSCGGGIVLRKRTVEVMRQTGTIVYLERDPELIFACIDTQSRPLIHDDGGNVRNLYETRRPLYEAAADVTVSNNADPDSAVREIMSALAL